MLDPKEEFSIVVAEDDPDRGFREEDMSSATSETVTCGTSQTGQDIDALFEEDNC
ncbi:MAG: hypothetical protein K9M03_02980 [Kiritimatiellales bacterium]|nr:hypothetical protein [Kiritimatiellales bacterium]